MSALVFSRRSPSSPNSVLAIVAKRRYRLLPGHPLSSTGEPAPIVVGPVLDPAREGAPRRRMREDSDLLCPFKQATDVLVRGHACSPRGPVAELWCGVAAGSVRKQLRVTGDRRVQVDSRGRATFRKPEPFDRMPLCWERAFGGWAPRPPGTFAGTAFPSVPVTYPRNAFGRGFFLDRDRQRAHDSPAPNLDDPEDPVTPERLFAPSAQAWLDLPAAACFEPIDWGTFPRSALGPDLRVFNCAPPGLARARLQGGERVTLWHLHPRAATVEFDLPRERPRFYLRPPGCGVHELSATLQTVEIEPDEERVTLTWSGSLEVAAPYPEAMCESMERGVRWSR